MVRFYTHKLRRTGLNGQFYLHQARLRNIFFFGKKFEMNFHEICETLVFLSTKCPKDLLYVVIPHLLPHLSEYPCRAPYEIDCKNLCWNLERKWFASLIYLYFLRNFSLTLKIVFVGNFNLIVRRKLHSLRLNCISWSKLTQKSHLSSWI